MTLIHCGKREQAGRRQSKQRLVLNKKTSTVAKGSTFRNKQAVLEMLG